MGEREEQKKIKLHSGKEENELYMDSRKIIYGVLKFMLHSSCSKGKERERERVDGGEGERENVVHDG